jgi:hypothetical protein
LPRVRQLAVAYLIALGLYGAELLATGHPVMAVFVLLLVLATRMAFRHLVPSGPAAARRLLVTADGALHVATVGGQIQRVELAGESLWLGSTVLLKLRARWVTYRVLLGAGNVEPAVLATLRRRLRGANSRGGIAGR